MQDTSITEEDCPCIVRADGSGTTRFVSYRDTGHVRCPDTGAITRWPFHAMRPGDVAIVSRNCGPGTLEHLAAQRAAHSYARSRGWKISTRIGPEFVTVKRIS